jgi:hypothetical protein
MPARAKQFDRGNFRARHFPHQGGGQFAVDEKIGGENSLHGQGLPELFLI